MFNIVRRGNFVLGPYRFENGTTFNPPPPPPFVPDRNFDGDSIYGLSSSTPPAIEASAPRRSLKISRGKHAAVRSGAAVES
jgi:hypothetical protein